MVLNFRDLGSPAEYLLSSELEFAGLDVAVVSGSTEMMLATGNTIVNLPAGLIVIP